MASSHAVVVFAPFRLYARIIRILRLGDGTTVSLSRTDVARILYYYCCRRRRHRRRGTPCNTSHNPSVDIRPPAITRCHDVWTRKNSFRRFTMTPRRDRVHGYALESRRNDMAIRYASKKTEKSYSNDTRIIVLRATARFLTRGH